MPAADSCGDPLLDKQLEGFLPVGCGAEAVFNFSWEKEVRPYGSGDDDDDDDDAVTTIWTTVIPTRTLKSTTAHRATTTRASVVRVTPNKSAPRLPPRFTASPEIRHSSFQHLLRIHLNTFNQRLSMLEGNTLDMKEGIRSMEAQQKHLSSQLKELIAIQSSTEKNKKVNELEKSYTDMEDRLSRLEGRLEILIDGFTALAQEMNKMKRARHVSRSPQERRGLPPTTTSVLPLPLYPTPKPPVKTVPTKTPFTRRATVPKSIPTPGLPSKKATTIRKQKSVATTKKTTTTQTVTRSRKNQVSSRLKVTNITLSKPKTTSKSKPQVTVKPETKRTAGKKSAVTVKNVSRPNQTRSRQVKKDIAVTKFQLESPSHTSRPPQKPKQANHDNKKDSAKNDGRNKAFRSDAPDPKQTQQSGKSPEGDSAKLSKPSKVKTENRTKTDSNSYKLVSPSHSRNSSGRDSVTTAKPAKATTAKKKSAATLKGTSTSAKTKATTVKKKPQIIVKGTSSPAKTKTTTEKKKPNSEVKRKSSNSAKKTKKKGKTNQHSGVLDLLRLLKGDHKSSKEKNVHDGSLHVILGRLAIPIKIIPDN